MLLSWHGFFFILGDYGVEKEAFKPR